MDNIEYKFNLISYAIISFITGLITIILASFLKYYIIQIVLGAMGMVISGYSFSISRYKDIENKVYIALSGIGIATNVIGFMVGMSLFVGVS